MIPRIYISIVEEIIKANSLTSPQNSCAYNVTSYQYVLSLIIIIIIKVTGSVMTLIQVVQEYERAVIFRLGRLLPGGAKGPGLWLTFSVFFTAVSFSLCQYQGLIHYI